MATVMTWCGGWGLPWAPVHGVAAVLEIARVLARRERAPRRSVVFVLTTAEESGLLGARYFLDHSPIRPVDMDQSDIEDQCRDQGYQDQGQ